MKRTIVVLFVITLLMLAGYTNKAESVLKGGYQSDPQENGYVVQMSFQEEDGSFVQYIDNREVDRGTYEKMAINHYKIDSEKQSHEITMDGKGNYEIIAGKINEGNLIRMHHIGDVPAYFPTVFGDEDEYKSLLEND